MSVPHNNEGTLFLILIVGFKKGAMQIKTGKRVLLRNLKV